MNKIKCIFIGCVELSQIAIIEIDKYFDIDIVFKAPSKSKKNISGYSDLNQFKLKSKPKVIKTFKLENHISKIKKSNAKLIFCIGWPRIIKSEILNLQNVMKIGFHSSLLPKYRGGAPVNWGLINNEKKWGGTLMSLGEGLDEGDIILQEKFAIGLNDNCRTVYLKLAASLVVLLEKFNKLYNKNKIIFFKQNNNKKTLYPKRRPSDGLIDWNLSSMKIYNFIRAQTLPYPCAFFYYENSKIKVISSDIYKYNKKFDRIRVGDIIQVIPHKGVVMKCKNSAILIKEVIYENLPITLFSTYLMLFNK